MLLLYDGYNKSTHPCLAYYPEFQETLDGTIKFRAVFRSPLAHSDDEERFFETDLQVYRFPAELLASFHGDQKRARVE